MMTTLFIYNHIISQDLTWTERTHCLSVALGMVVYTASSNTWEAEASRPLRDLSSRPARVDNINPVPRKTEQPECMLLLRGTWDMAAHQLPKPVFKRSDNPLDMRANQAGTIHRYKQNTCF